MRNFISIRRGLINIFATCFNFEEDASEIKRKKESRTEQNNKAYHRLRESQAGELLFRIYVGKFFSW